MAVKFYYAVVLLYCYVSLLFCKMSLQLIPWDGVRSKYVCQTINMGKCLRIMETSTKLKKWSKFIATAMRVTYPPPPKFQNFLRSPEPPPISPSTPASC